MSEEKQPRERFIPIWGIFLLFLGVVFLLQSLDILPWGLWGTLWRFWPVLIIIIGLGILLRRYDVWLVSLVMVALLFTCLGIAIWQYGQFPPAGQTTGYSEPLAGLEQAQIEIDFSAGRLTINSLSSGSLNFVEASSMVRDGDTGMRTDFRRQGNAGRLYLKRESVSWSVRDAVENRWQVTFSRNVPLAVDIKLAASDVVLDLSQLQITELRMEADLGNYVVKMPSPAGTINADIKVNLANLEVIIPEDVAVKLKTDVDLGYADVDRSRFLREGDSYLTRDFEGAKNRIELEVDGALGRMQLK